MTQIHWIWLVLLNFSKTVFCFIWSISDHCYIMYLPVAVQKHINEEQLLNRFNTHIVFFYYTLFFLCQKPWFSLNVHSLGDGVLLHQQQHQAEMRGLQSSVELTSFNIPTFVSISCLYSSVEISPGSCGITWLHTVFLVSQLYIAFSNL